MELCKYERYKMNTVSQIAVIIFILTLTSIVQGQGDSATTLTYDLFEEQAQNTLVGDVKDDANLRQIYDTSTLNLLTFSLLSDSEYFVVEQYTGLLRTARTIDRDVLCQYSIDCSISLDIVVQPIQYFQIIKVSIHIIDINDNFPVFSENEVTISISETTQPLATFPLPGATDADSGNYGIQSYQLLSYVDKFQLQLTSNGDGTSDVQLVLLTSLDHEVQQVYQLQIVARDGGTPPKSGTIRINVKVVDANDNNPHFEKTNYTAYVYENVPIRSVIITVKAIDLDIGENGDITYEFSQSTVNQFGEIFGIDDDTGEIYAKSEIDYELASSYVLGVVAKDRGSNSLSDYTKVTVHVRDINDHAPEIKINALSATGNAEVAENSASGTFVAHISVNDKDSSQNGEFSCSVNSDKFMLVQLFATEFKLVAKTVFDREREDVYDVDINCVDAGNAPQTSSQHVKITVTDQNDHEPIFASDTYSVTVRENNAVNEIILEVGATDEDIGANGEVEYSLQYPYTSREVYELSIESTTGVVRSNIRFDYEQMYEYTFLIIAYDNGLPSLSATATLSLSVLDINDEPPMFVQTSYAFGTYENQPMGTEIGTVEALDRDSSGFDSISYVFDYSKMDASVFSIDSISGVITTRKVLDREEVESYRLIVIARNDGYALSSSVNVTVHIADVNDNAPYLVFPSPNNNTVQVASTSSKGSIVAKVEASDMDVGRNGALVYSILGGNGGEVFEINPANGDIEVYKNLRTYEDEYVHLTLLVEDQGDEPLSAITELNIFVNATMGALLVTQKGRITEVNLAIIVSLTLVAFFLLLAVLITIMVFRRRCNVHERLRNERRLADKQNFMKLRRESGNGPNGVKVENTKNAEEEEKEKNEFGFPVIGADTKMYLQQQTVVADNSLEKISPTYVAMDGKKSKKSTSTKDRRKVHFAEKNKEKEAFKTQTDDYVGPNEIEFEDEKCKHEECSDGWKCFREEPRHSLLYRMPSKSSSGPTMELQLQVQDAVHSVAHGDQDSDNGSSDSGRGPSEEEEHGRHTLSDSQIFSNHSPVPFASTVQEPSIRIPKQQFSEPRAGANNLQHCFCSCKENSSRPPDTPPRSTSSPRCKLENMPHSHNSCGTDRQSNMSPFRRQALFNDACNNIEEKPVVPPRCSQSKTPWLNNKPNHNPVPQRVSGFNLVVTPVVKSESEDVDSDGGSTTTSGSYTVDPEPGPHISPIDIYV